MKYNFDEEIGRIGTNSIKWDFTDKFLGVKNILPMWVADMDFKAPEPVISAIKRRARHGIYGYTGRSDSYYDAIINWVKIRHNWEISRRWLTDSPGIVAGLALSILTFTKPGDKIVIQPPVYTPFFDIVRENGRQLVLNNLKLENGRYKMDFDDLKNKIDSGTKMLILCSPHNPVGRVWTEEELFTLGDICDKNDIVILSDEIHSDIVYSGHKHIPIASISPDMAARTITFIAPSKTFNIAGLLNSAVIIPNEKLYNDYVNKMHAMGLHLGNLFGIEATEACYRHGEGWLEELIIYLEDNLSYLIDYFNKNIKNVKIIIPEGTYLVWLDFRATGYSADKVNKLLREKARIGLNDGRVFGPGGEGFERINIGCPRSMLKEGLERIKSVFA